MLEGVARTRCKDPLLGTGSVCTSLSESLRLCNLDIITE